MLLCPGASAERRAHALTSYCQLILLGHCITAAIKRKGDFARVMGPLNNGGPIDRELTRMRQLGGRCSAVDGREVVVYALHPIITLATRPGCADTAHAQTPRMRNHRACAVVGRSETVLFPITAFI
ncbi:hypothetical protein J6590_038723 [Homalodisca vitripennis]|nr:hypothetical protein J6590_038723 [Homalodisca vitripennis]